MITMPDIFNDYFSQRAFLQGLLAGAVFIIFAWGFALFNTKTTIKNLENSLNTRTVLIENIYEEESASYLNDVNIETQDTPAPSMADIASYQPIKNRKSLYPAPINGLFERSPLGLLPKISQNNISPFDAYKKSFSSTGNPLIMIAVLNYGLQDSVSKNILSTLSNNISLIVSPYSSAPQEWQKTARENGFETWLHLPAQTKDFTIKDPGAKALMAQTTLKDNQDTLNWLLTRTSGYAGVALETDHVLIKSKPITNLITGSLFGRGLGFFEINTQAPILIETIAAGKNAPFIKNDIVLNDTSLKNLEKIAREKGYVIGVIKPYPNAIKALKIWSDTLEAKNIDLAPLSAVLSINNHE